MQPAQQTAGPGYKASFAGIYDATKVSLGRVKDLLTPETKTEEQRVAKANASVAKRKVINDRIAIGAYGIIDKAVVGPFGVLKAVGRGTLYAVRGKELAATPGEVPGTNPVEANASAAPESGINTTPDVTSQSGGNTTQEPHATEEPVGLLQKLGLHK